MTSSEPNFWTAFMPHGQCYLWRPDILWLNVLSDGFIALAYFSIPIGLFLVLRNRPDMPYKPVLLMFSVFILACGFTHLVSIWTVWNGDYGLHGLAKGFTAIVSMATAIMLFPLLPKIIALKSPEELKNLNAQLLSEIERQRESSKKLRQTERKLRTFLQLAPDGILIMRASGLIEYSNNMVNTMFGYQENGLTGKYANKILPHRSQSKIGPTHNDLFKTDGSLWRTSGAELTGVRKDESELPVEIRINPILTEEDGDVTLATLRDISYRKAREEKERKELLKIAHVSRLGTVGQMAAGLAHELNQPLTAISNNLHTAMAIQREQENPDPLLTQMMQENYDSAQRAGQIIKSLRQLVSKDDGQNKTTNINELVANTAKLITPEAHAANVNIKLNLEEEMPITLLDRTQIQQALVNLGRNAIEALIEYREDDRAITISTKAIDESNLQVQVADNGPGLNTYIKDNLFKPYLTSKETGMGLGLPISRSIIEAHEGQLWYQEHTKGGAVFSFALPIINEENNET